jgi:PQQ enzyme-like repeat protein
VFFGDIGGNFYALDAANGEKLWSQDLGGAIGGGVITYTANGGQKVAVTTGFTHIAWPTKIVTAKIIVLGLVGPLQANAKFAACACIPRPQQRQGQHANHRTLRVTASPRAAGCR